LNPYSEFRLDSALTARTVHQGRTAINGKYRLSIFFRKSLQISELRGRAAEN